MSGTLYQILLNLKSFYEDRPFDFNVLGLELIEVNIDFEKLFMNKSHIPNTMLNANY